MNLEIFFEKFDLCADTPNAVAKMRSLLIQFAINGNLVTNNPQEKPIELSLSGPLPSDVGLPSNWRLGCVGDVFNFQYGDNLPAPKRTETGEYPVYGSNGIVGTHSTYLTKESAIIVGRKGSAGALNISVGPSWTTDVAYFICPPSELDLQFTFYLFSTLHLDHLGKGIKPGLNRKDAYALPISIPPLAEQKRIVAKVDELMALCDQLEAEQKEREKKKAALARASLAHFTKASTPANLNFLFHQSYDISPADLRKAILSLAVKGLLVSHESESVNWQTKRLKDLTAKIGSGSTPLGGKDSYQGSGVPLIRSMNVHSNGFKNTGMAFLNAEQAAKLNNVVVKTDDVLLNITGASIGRVTTAPQEMDGARVNQHVCIIRPTAEILSTFLQLFLASPIVQDNINEIQVGATREALTKAMIEQFEIPLPPLAEQRRIVAKVDELMALVDDIEKNLTAARTTATNLLDAVVAELTSGKK